MSREAKLSSAGSARLDNGNVYAAPASNSRRLLSFAQSRDRSGLPGGKLAGVSRRVAGAARRFV